MSVPTCSYSCVRLVKSLMYCAKSRVSTSPAQRKQSAEGAKTHVLSELFKVFRAVDGKGDFQLLVIGEGVQPEGGDGVDVGPMEMQALEFESKRLEWIRGSEVKIC